MGRHDEVEDGMGFSGLAPDAAEREGERDRRQARWSGWNDAIETAVRILESEVGNRQEIDARSRSIRSLKK